MDQVFDVPSIIFFHSFMQNSLQKSFQFIFIFFYKFTKIRIKSFECPKFMMNYEKEIMFVRSDTWSMSRSSHRPSKPAYYIEDCRISSVPHLGRWTGGDLRSNYAWDLAGLNYNCIAQNLLKPN